MLRTNSLRSPEYHQSFGIRLNLNEITLAPYLFAESIEIRLPVPIISVNADETDRLTWKRLHTNKLSWHSGVSHELWLCCGSVENLNRHAQCFDLDLS